MGDCAKDECCHTQKESCHDHHYEESKFDWLLEIADEAWTEVLKDKIKEHILKNQGKKMDELAEIVSEANGARWKHKMEKKQKCREFKEKICHFFGSKK